MNRLPHRLAALLLPLIPLSCTLEDRATSPGSKTPRVGTAEQAFPDRVGTPRAGALLGEPVRYRAVDGKAVVGGDIVVPEKTVQEAALGKASSVGRAAAASRWNNNLVYYRFAAGFSKATEANAAIAHWEAKTNLRFVLWNSSLSGHPDVLEFQSTAGAGCWSGGIGKMGGVQVINLDASCSSGNAIHEIGHAIGLYHEQSRSDQASIIAVDLSNVPASAKDRYYVYSNPLRGSVPLDGADRGPMDFGSVMMDGSFDFALDPAKPVMAKLAGGGTWTGQRAGLSAGDIAGVALMYPSFWKSVPGVAVDVGVGADGSAYMLGSAKVTGGNAIYKWSGTAWTLISGGAIHLDVDPAGVPWIVNGSNDILTLNGTTWTNRDAGKKFMDVGIGSEGSVFAVSKTASGSGYQLLKWTGSAWNVFNSGGASRVTVDNSGKPWIVNSAKAVQRWDGNAWVTLTGTGTDIGAGPDGSVYLIENTATTGGKTVSVWGGSAWKRLDKGGIAVDAGPGGSPWMATDVGNVWVGGDVAGAAPQAPAAAGWITESVPATAIGLGGTAAAPTAYALTTNDVPGDGKELLTRSGSGPWQTAEGGLVALDGAPTGMWGVNIINDIYYWNAGGWTLNTVGYKFTAVGVGGEGSVFAVSTIASGKGFQLYKWKGSSWGVFASGGAVRVTVDNAGKPWIIDNEGTVLRWDGAAWAALKGSATAIAAGADGSIYKLGTVNVTGGKTVWRWSGAGWIEIDAGAVALDVDALGNPWLVGADHSLKSWNPGSAGLMPPVKAVPDRDPTPGEPPPPDGVWLTENVLATDVGIGGTGGALSAWAAGTGSVNGGKTLLQKTAIAGAPWQLIAGGLLRLDADTAGTLWTVDSGGDAYTFSGGAWMNRSAGKKFSDVGVGSQGSVFAVSRTASGAGYQLYTWAGSAWILFASGGATRVTVDNTGNPWIVNAHNTVQRWTGTAWATLPGSGTDVGAGADGTVYKVGTVDVTGGKAVWRWTGTAWAEIEGAAVAVDVDPAGNPYLVQSDNVVKSWSRLTAGFLPPLKASPDADPDTIVPPPVPGSWQTEATQATEISVGGRSDSLVAWAATMTDIDGGKTLARKAPPTSGSWQAMTGAAARLEADPAGRVWVVNSYNDIWYYDGTWTNRGNGAKFVDIGIGADGSVFAVSANAASATGNFLCKWNGSGWSAFPSSGALRVSVDPSGYPWIVDNRNLLQRWNGTSWIALPGSAADVGVGADGTAYKLGTLDVTGGKTVWRWSGSAWIEYDVGAVALDVDPAGNPWLVQADHALKSWSRGTVNLPPAAKAVPDADPDPLPAPAGSWVIRTVQAADIGVGGTGSTVKALAATPGGLLRMLDSATGNWNALEGVGAAVDVDRSGTLWSVDATGEILCDNGNGTGFQVASNGKHFSDVGVGQDGTVFAVSTIPAPRGFQLYHWTGTDWGLWPGEGAVRVTVDNSAHPWIVNSDHAVQRWDGNTWVTLPGSGTDIGAGADGSVYKVGTVAVAGGRTVWRWASSAWSQVDAGAIAIDADARGNPWLVLSDNSVLAWVSGADTLPPVKASPDPDPDAVAAPLPPTPGAWRTELTGVSEIGVGGTPDAVEAWAATTDPAQGGKALMWRGRRTYQEWQPAPMDGAVRVDVDVEGTLWSVNDSGDVWTFFEGMAGQPDAFLKMSDVAPGPAGSAFGVTHDNPLQAGKMLVKWDGSGWNQFPSNGATKVSVDPMGNPWIITSGYAVQRWTGATWASLPGSASEISIGGDGTIYKLGALPLTGAKPVWKWGGSAWIETQVTALSIDVDANGDPWVVGADNTLRRWARGTDLADPPAKTSPDVDPEPGSPLLPPANPAGWTQLPGIGDIVAFTGSAVANGYALDKSNIAIGGYALRWFSAGQSTLIARRFVDLDVAKDCEVWAVADSGIIFVNTNACVDPNAWQQMSGPSGPQYAKITAGPGATPTSPSNVYALTKTNKTDPYPVLYQRMSDGSWSNTTMSFDDVDVRGDGILMVVGNGAVGVYYPGSQYPVANAMGFGATSIAAEGDRFVGLVPISKPGGWEIRGWMNRYGWVPIANAPGLSDVMIAPNGMIWGADLQHRIWFYNPTFEPGPLPAPPYGYVPNF